MARQEVKGVIVGRNLHQIAPSDAEQSVDGAFIGRDLKQAATVEQLGLPGIGMATGKWAVLALAVVAVIGAVVYLLR